MAPASNEDQFKFLISCIRYSDNGKVDFDLVARECNIVSKGAAAKRYERLMKTHGIHQSQMSTVDTIRNTPVSSRPRASASGTQKKRKLNSLAEASLNADDDEGLPTVKPEKSGTKAEAEHLCAKFENEPVKTETKIEDTSAAIMKEESNAKDGTSERTKSGKQKAADIPQYDGASDEGLMRDFLAFGASANHVDIKDLGLGGTSIQDKVAGLGVTSTDNGAQSAQESILIADWIAD